MTGALAGAHDGAMPTTVTDDRPPPPRALRRPAEGRIIGGVAAAVADYLDLDRSVVRIGAVALVLLGGAGVPLYLAGWLLIPADGAPSSVAEDFLGHARARCRRAVTTPPRGPRPGRFDPPWSAAWRAADDRHLRASDQERNEMAETLCGHYADGRLDEAEFKSRLDRAMGATTLPTSTASAAIFPARRSDGQFAAGVPGSPPWCWWWWRC